MYAIFNIEDQTSYATAANAIRAVERVFGKPADRIEREFNVFMVHNSAGRFVPVIASCQNGAIVSKACRHFLTVN